MHKFALLMLLILSSVFAASARAEEIYDFSFTQGAGTQVQSVEFFFTPQNFFEPGDYFLFGPFEITDGGGNYSIIGQGLAGLSSGTGCFDFGSENAFPILGNCSATTAGPPGGVLAFNFSSGFPSMAGVFNATVSGGFWDRTSNTFLIAGGNGTLTITDVQYVPEPASSVLFVTGAVLFGWRFRRRVC